MGALMSGSQTANEEKQRTTGDIARDVARAFTQGITFGTADELEAFVRSYIDSDKSYTELRDEIRTDINQFRKNSPYFAYGLEIAGSLPSGVLGVGKTLGATALRSGAMSGAYGFGSSEGDIKDRATSAAISAPIGAVAGPLVQKIMPNMTSQAKELANKGVNLTPGQATSGGLVGKSIKAVEEGATSIPLLGTMIKGSMDRSTTTFNRAVINDALKSIGKVLPPRLTGRKAIEWAKNEISKSYDDVIGKMSLNNADDLIDTVSIISTNLKGNIDSKLYNNFNNKLSEIIIARVKDGKLTGKSLQNIQTDIKKLITQYTKSGGTAEFEMADALTTILKGKIDDAGEKIIFGLDDFLLRDNAPELITKFTNTNTAYSLFDPIQKASVSSASSGGTFSPAQLLNAIKKSDPTKTKSQFATGGGKLQDIAETAEEVIGANIPNSGTADRLAAKDFATAGGLLLGGQTGVVDPTLAMGGLLAAGAYSKPVQKITTGALLGAGGFAQDAVAPLSSQIAQQDILKRF